MNAAKYEQHMRWRAEAAEAAEAARRLESERVRQQCTFMPTFFTQQQQQHAHANVHSSSSASSSSSSPPAAVGAAPAPPHAHPVDSSSSNFYDRDRDRGRPLHGNGGSGGVRTFDGTAMVHTKLSGDQHIRRQQQARLQKQQQEDRYVWYACCHPRSMGAAFL